jgi:hypothetical protein
MLKIKNQLAAGSGLLVKIVGHHYGSRLLDYRKEMIASKQQELKEIVDKASIDSVQQKLDNLYKVNDTLIKKLDNLLTRYVHESDLADEYEK